MAKKISKNKQELFESLISFLIEVCEDEIFSDFSKKEKISLVNRSGELVDFFTVLFEYVPEKVQYVLSESEFIELCCDNSSVLLGIERYTSQIEEEKDILQNDRPLSDFFISNDLKKLYKLYKKGGMTVSEYAKEKKGLIYG